MIDFVLHALRSNPEIAVFLAIGLGVLIGRIQLGSFHLGSVAGALLMGLVIGQIGLDVPHELKSVFLCCSSMPLASRVVPSSLAA